MIERIQSQKLFEEAKKLFPGGVNSPVRAFKSVDGPPIFVEKGKGAKLYDEDGNVFLDFCGSWGPLILGHADEGVIEYVKDALSNGTSFGTPSVIGNKLGSLIVNNHSFLDQIRFVSSGTEAVMSAIRLARGYTEKKYIVKFEGCYHGHVDSLLVKAGSGLATFGTSSSAGVPQELSDLTLVLPLDDESAIDECFAKYGDQIAAVIIEPIPANNGLLLQRKAFLEHLRKTCTSYQSLLIFDEVISGFRVGFEGASGVYDIAADLYTFGKIIGGGMPVGAFGGKKEIMEYVAPLGPVYQAGTLSANPITMSAGYATLQRLLSDNFYQHLEQKAKTLANSIEELIQKEGYDMGIQRIGSIFWLKFTQGEIRRADQIDASKMELFKTLHSILLNDSVYLGPSGYEVGFVSAAHSDEDIYYGSQKIRKAIDQIFQT